MAPNTYSIEEWTFKSLQKAAQENSVGEIQRIMNLDKNINAKDVKTSNTALHEAAIHGSEDVFNYLIAQKADINALNNSKQSPLFCALQNHNSFLVAPALLAGANPLQIDENGISPITLAAKNNNISAVKQLFHNAAQKSSAFDDARLEAEKLFSNNDSIIIKTDKFGYTPLTKLASTIESIGILETITNLLSESAQNDSVSGTVSDASTVIIGADKTSNWTDAELAIILD